MSPRSTGGLPGRLTLLAAALLLAAEGDDLARDVGLVDGDGTANATRLQRLRDRALARNKSVLAHGTESISDQHTESLRAEASELLSAYWRRHGDPVDLPTLLDQLRFIETDR